jgi:hypothetical protein
MEMAKEKFRQSEEFSNILVYEYYLWKSAVRNCPE